jgi:hypothetical protein
VEVSKVRLTAHPGLRGDECLGHQFKSPQGGAARSDLRTRNVPWCARLAFVAGRQCAGEGQSRGASSLVVRRRNSQGDVGSDAQHGATTAPSSWKQMGASVTRQRPLDSAQRRRFAMRAGTQSCYLCSRRGRQVASVSYCGVSLRWRTTSRHVVLWCADRGGI